MKNFNITFVALSEAKEIHINSEHDIDAIVGDLLMAFSPQKNDCESFVCSIDSLQQNTEELRSKISSVVQKYKTHNPKIQRLNTYFSKLKPNESFFIIPGTSVNEEQSFVLYNYLLALEKGEDFRKMSEEIDCLFGELRNSYEIFVFDENTRKKIGEPEKQQRVCRYCDKSCPEVSFKTEAHSISEALGNKKVITYDECDTCNEKFGRGIETDLISYLSIYRVLFRVKGKNGVPKLKGKNFEITNNEAFTIRQMLSDEEIKDLDPNNLKFILNTTQNITIQNIYKTLVKYAIGVIDRVHIANFKKTIAWINGVETIETLPKVAVLTSYDLFTEHPKLIVYLRKNEETKLPYAVAEFRFTFLTFVYIIPGASKDSTDFTKDEEYKTFWSFFKHYSSASNWSFQKMSNNMARPFVLNLEFNKR